MRRSRSSTNIPGPMSKATSANRDRAKSVQRMSTTPLIQRQLSVGTSGYGQTPLNRHLSIATPLGGSGRSARTGRPMRSSSLSIGSRVSSQRTKSPASNQKMVNDKKWVAEQYLEICNYIHTSECFRPEIAGMIRPPTINIFIELVTTLFSTLIKTIPINKQNYAEIVINNLKILKYPENLTMSTMKTVNTMHAWPHFIAIISFLINKNKINDARPMNWINKEIKTPQDAFWKILCLKYENFNGMKTGISDEMLNKGLYKELSMLYGVDREAIEDKERKKAKCEAEVAELDQQLEEIKAEILKIQGEMATKQEVMKDFEENDENNHQKLDQEINNLKQSIMATRERIKEMDLINAGLEKTIANQKYSRNQKSELSNEIEEILRIIQRKEAKIKNHKTIRHELDCELVQVVRELEQKVDAWNMGITKSLLPEIDVLSLREKGFHSRNFLQELKEAVVKSKAIQEQLLEELEKLQLKMDEWKQKEESLNKRKNAVKSKKNQAADLKLKTEEIQNRNKEICTKIEQTQKSLNTNCSVRQSLEAQIRQEEAEICDVKKSINTMNERMETDSKKGIALLLEARSKTLEAIRWMDGMMLKELNEITELAKQREQEVLNLMDELKNSQLQLSL